jgi:hypothetical protein
MDLSHACRCTSALPGETTSNPEWLLPRVPSVCAVENGDPLRRVESVNSGGDVDWQVGCFLVLRRSFVELTQLGSKTHWARILRGSFPIGLVLPALAGLLSVQFVSCTHTDYAAVVADRPYMMLRNQEQLGHHSTTYSSRSQSGPSSPWGSRPLADVARGTDTRSRIDLITVEHGWQAGTA